MPYKNEAKGIAANPKANCETKVRLPCKGCVSLGNMKDIIF